MFKPISGGSRRETVTFADWKSDRQQRTRLARPSAVPRWTALDDGDCTTTGNPVNSSEDLVERPRARSCTDDSSCDDDHDDNHKHGNYDDNMSFCDGC